MYFRSLQHFLEILNRKMKWKRGEQYWASFGPTAQSALASPRQSVSRAHALGRSPRPMLVRWHGQWRLCGGFPLARSTTRAPVMRAAPAGQKVGRWGSPKHRANGEVAEDGGTVLFNGGGAGVRWLALPRSAPVTRGR
jgi:hypothetical protein